MRIWWHNGQLKYRAPKGALTQGELQLLKDDRECIKDAMAELSCEQWIPASADCHRAPLAYTQLGHWNLYRLNDHASRRQLASAVRMQGSLSIPALRKGLEAVIERHEALRTRIVRCGEVLAQEIATSAKCDFEFRDLTALSEPMRAEEVQACIYRLILEPIDVTIGPLFGLRLLRVASNEHVMALAIEHIVSDGVSIGLFWNDLFAAYAQAAKGCAVELPAVRVQFSDYARAQWNTSGGLPARSGSYCDEHLRGSQRLRFPSDKNAIDSVGLSWGTVPIVIQADLKRELTDWSRRNRTTLVLTVFTAYAALVLQWCDAAEGVFQYTVDGRVSPGIQHTIGYFASLLYLRISLRERDSFRDFLDQVMKEYCFAQNNFDFSFLRAQIPRPEYTRNTIFNWITTDVSQVDTVLDDRNGGMAISTFEFKYPVVSDVKIDNEPSIIFFEKRNEIVGDLSFPTARFSIVTFEAFRDDFLRLLVTLCRRPDKKIKEIALDRLARVGHRQRS